MASDSGNESATLDGSNAPVKVHGSLTETGYIYRIEMIDNE